MLLAFVIPGIMQYVQQTSNTSNREWLHGDVDQIVYKTKNNFPYLSKVYIMEIM